MTGPSSKRPDTSNDVHAPRQRRKSWVVLPALGALVLLLALACGSPGAEPSVGSAEPEPSTSSDVEMAPALAFTLFQGEGLPAGDELQISDLTGKPVVLNFWAGLCPPCRAEMPDLQAFYDENKEDATLVGVDVGQFMGLGSQADAENLLRELNITYPAGFTNDSNVIPNYKVIGMPTTVFINADGSIFERWTGVLDREVLEEKVQMMLEPQG